jgi:hypothetical protein
MKVRVRSEAKHQSFQHLDETASVINSKITHMILCMHVVVTIVCCLSPQYDYQSCIEDLEGFKLPFSWI